MNKNKIYDEDLELSNEQSDRVDEVCEAVMDLCKVMCEDPELEWDMQFIGEIADTAAHILTSCGKRVRYPSVVTEADGSQYIEEYYGE
ncbi:MAG: hypothetical protein LUE31_08365 [Lachnospiraceae bacterium]|nr:hypothetical protein [Lachnospiraceae bacterium]